MAARHRRADRGCGTASAPDAPSGSGRAAQGGHELAAPALAVRPTVRSLVLATDDAGGRGMAGNLLARLKRRMAGRPALLRVAVLDV